MSAPSTLAVRDDVASPPSRGLVAGGVVAAAGVLLLLARPWLLPAGEMHRPRVLLFVVLGVVGAAWPLSSLGSPPVADRPHRPVLFALAVGSAAFVVVRLLVGVAPRPPELIAVLVLNGLAAVAEEAFFRRLVYGLLAPWGAGVAVVGSAVLFALAHVTVWGLWVLPLDLAAGLLLSWQRAASGRWTVPATTHVLANTLAFL